MEKQHTRKLTPEVQQQLSNEAIRLRNSGCTYAEIHWVNETGLINNAYYHRSYAPIGKTPAIRIPGKHE